MSVNYSPLFINLIVFIDSFIIHSGTLWFATKSAAFSINRCIHGFPEPLFQAYSIVYLTQSLTCVSKIPARLYSHGSLGFPVDVFNECIKITLWGFHHILIQEIRVNIFNTQLIAMT